MKRMGRLGERSVWLALLLIMFFAGFWLAVSVRATAGDSIGSLLPGSPPAMVSYQGVVEIASDSFSGNGHFKFALVAAASGDGTANTWANDGTGSGEPAAAVPLEVVDGLFNVLLGDTTLTNMTAPLDETAVAETDTYLRVWFSESGDTGSFAALEPNQRLASAPYALRARQADSAPSGIAAAIFVAGFGGSPGPEPAFLSPWATVTVAEGESVFVVSTKALGTSTGAQSLDLYTCWRATGSGDEPTSVGGGLLNMRLNPTQRIPFTLNGIISGLAPGEYDVGMCGDDDGNGNWNNNEWGYTSALVIRPEQANFAIPPILPRVDHE